MDSNIPTNQKKGIPQEILNLESAQPMYIPALELYSGTVYQGDSQLNFLYISCRDFEFIELNTHNKVPFFA